MPTILTTMSVIGGGISGALHATTRKMDITGILFVAICTGVGGGAVRDVLLGHGVPFFLVHNLVAMAFVGALAGFFFARFVEQLGPAIYTIDTLLVGFWVVIGAEKALRFGLDPMAAVFLGLTTAVAGGIIRDVLCREIPTALMPGQWVGASAALASVSFVLIYELTSFPVLAEATAIFMATMLRALGARYGWYTTDAVTMSNQLRRALRLTRRKQPEEQTERVSSS